MENGTIDSFLSKLDTLRIGRYQGGELPYKPLLLIFAIARYLDGDERLFSFAAVRPRLVVLFNEFVPDRRETYPELPFWGLKLDGIWDIPDVIDPPRPLRNPSDKRKHLERYNARGGFTEDLYRFARDELNASVLLTELLDRFFPDERTRVSVVKAVGIHKGYLTHRKYREPSFSNRVLLAYRHQCAICGYSAFLNSVVVGVEAAHIMAHSQGGPDTEQNGLALCALHHKLFDYGVIGINEHYRILVSSFVHGTSPFDQIVSRYSGEQINTPRRSELHPDASYLKWHLSEIYNQFEHEYMPV